MNHAPGALAGDNYIQRIAGSLIDRDRETIKRLERENAEMRALLAKLHSQVIAAWWPNNLELEVRALLARIEGRHDA